MSGDGVTTRTESATTPENFFSSSLTEMEQLELPAARRLDGLAEEIAVLRVKLKTALAEHPKDFRLMTACVGLLVKAVATEYRLSPKSKKDLAEGMAAVLNSFGDQLLPPDR